MLARRKLRALHFSSLQQKEGRTDGASLTVRKRLDGEKILAEVLRGGKTGETCIVPLGKPGRGGRKTIFQIVREQVINHSL